MVRGMSVAGGSLHGKGESSHCRVDLRGGAEYSQACQAYLVRKEQVKRREARLNGQNVGRGAGKAVCVPSLGLVPKGREFSHHMDSRGEHVPAIPKNAKEQR